MSAALPHVIIGTAGHVDHGKTCLIQALTGVNTDRLPEERARGLTIELGFAPLNFPDGLQAGIVDVPGHEKFIRHMLCGAGGMDLAMLVIAADEGVRPQTVEHLEILELLGVRGGLTVLSKADRGTRLRETEREARALIRGTFLESGPLLCASARTGEGIPALREALYRLILAAPGRNLQAPFRLPLDRIFTVEGFGTVATGTLLEGVLRREDPVELVPGGGRGRVRGLQVFGRETDAVYAGQRAAVNLTGLPREALRRGDVLTAPGSLTPSLLLDADLRLLDRACPLPTGAEVRLYHGASVRTARAVLLERDSLSRGQCTPVQLRLTEPLGARAGDRFVVRIPSPPETVGGGVILDPDPPRHRRRDPAVLESLSVRRSGSPALRLLQRLESLGETGKGALFRDMDLPQAQCESALEELLLSGQALEAAPGRYLASSGLERLQLRCKAVLEEYHRAHPLEEGIRGAELRQKLGAAAGVPDLLVSSGTLRQAGDGRYALPEFRVTLTRRQEAIRRTVLGLCAGMGRHTPCPETLAARFPLRDRADLRMVLEYLLSEGALVLLAPDVLCCAGDLAAYRQAAEAWFRTHGTLSLAEYRDLLGVSRDYALLVLEYFDRQGWTRREGDTRRQIARLWP